jgi:hypothetical protein
MPRSPTAAPSAAPRPATDASIADSSAERRVPTRQGRPDCRQRQPVGRAVDAYAGRAVDAYVRVYRRRLCFAGTAQAPAFRDRRRLCFAGTAIAPASRDRRRLCWPGRRRLCWPGRRRLCCGTLPLARRVPGSARGPRRCASPARALATPGDVAACAVRLPGTADGLGSMWTGAVALAAGRMQWPYPRTGDPRVRG